MGDDVFDGAHGADSGGGGDSATCVTVSSHDRDFVAPAVAAAAWPVGATQVMKGGARGRELFTVGQAFGCQNEPCPSRPIRAGEVLMETTRTKLRGVNLGSWLLLEKWMVPSLFEGLEATDETTWCARLGPAATERLRRHWAASSPARTSPGSPHGPQRGAHPDRALDLRPRLPYHPKRRPPPPLRDRRHRGARPCPRLGAGVRPARDHRPARRARMPERLR